MGFGLKRAYSTQCTTIKGIMVSIRWYLGCLEGQFGGVLG